MNKKTSALSSKNMVSSSKNKNKVLSCSTPEQPESPSRDSDSICDSEAASPVPFFCTQDGLEGETDVVWNYYTPKTGPNSNSRRVPKNSTPLSRRKRTVKQITIEKPPPRKRANRNTQKKTELFQDLIELNQNVYKIIEKAATKNESQEKQQSGSEEDIFNNSGDYSPKSGLKTNSRCLRKNLLSSKFNCVQEPENVLESDDSMNECLIKASQVVEENVIGCVTQGSMKNNYQDSIDSILNNVTFETPVNKSKKYQSPQLNNDSFDNFVGDLNDSALERLTQMPLQNNTPVKLKRKDSSGWVLQELKVHESPSSKSVFGRHSSMPESPTVADLAKPSTSGMIFGRYNSMPYNKNDPKNTVIGDSPSKCTPDEIKRKRLQAREKLLAKGLLPFTATQTAQATQQQSQQHIAVSVPKKAFKPKTATITRSTTGNSHPSQSSSSQNLPSDNIKSLIEKKRQEALMKLRNKQLQNKQNPSNLKK